MKLTGEVLLIIISSLDYESIIVIFLSEIDIYLLFINEAKFFLLKININFNWLHKAIVPFIQKPVNWYTL